MAIKSMPKNKLGNTIDYINQEIDILQKLDHPNIVKYYEAYESDKYIYLVMEYCEGEELFDKLSALDAEPLTEANAKVLMKKLLQAINHCHANNIAHRDIKPENIMFKEQNGEFTGIKLIDFGLAQSAEQAISDMVGTPYYLAPEVLKKQYGIKCDIWSMGVIMYILLSGYLPFAGGSAPEVFKKIQSGEFSFDQEEWTSISESAKNLIRKMLVLDPK